MTSEERVLLRIQSWQTVTLGLFNIAVKKIHRRGTYPKYPAMSFRDKAVPHARRPSKHRGSSCSRKQRGLEHQRCIDVESNNAKRKGPQFACSLVTGSQPCPRSKAGKIDMNHSPEAEVTRHLCIHSNSMEVRACLELSIAVESRPKLDR